MSSSPLRLVVVPTDPLAIYDRTGYDWLERYFNPQGMFDEVFAISPKEKGEYKAYGMTVLGVPEREFAGTLRKIRPNVVRAYGSYWPADLVCRNRVPGIPVIVSVHETRPSLIYRSVRYADLVICLTREVEKRVLAVGTDPGRIRLLPNRVDTKLFRPIKDEAALQSVASRFPPGKHILQVGRKAYEKNLDTVIRALEFLPSDYSSIFVGLGDLTPYISLAEEVGVTDRCFWVDAVKNSELPLWYSWCDCVCLLSRFPSEGFPLVSLEAAACGSAMIMSDIPPMNNYLTHHENAYLVKDYENPQVVAEAIRKVCEDSEYRCTLSDGAVKMAQRFDLPVVDAMEVAIYRDAMNLGPLSLSRRLELAAWRTQEALEVAGRRMREAAAAWRGRVSPGRVARAIKRRIRRLWG